MNRVLDHNLRNKMNLLAGYADLLRSDLDDPDALKSVEVIAETTDDLMRIATAARKIDHTLSAPRRRRRAPGCAAGSRNSRAGCAIGTRGDDHPLTPPGRLARHDGRRAADGDRGGSGERDQTQRQPEPRRGRSRRATIAGWLAVEITDNGPGIPDHETRVLDRGETPLTHADRLGIWLIYWVVSKAGGEFSVDTSAEGDHAPTGRAREPLISRRRPPPCSQRPFRPDPCEPRSRLLPARPSHSTSLGVRHRDERKPVEERRPVGGTPASLANATAFPSPSRSAVPTRATVPSASRRPPAT